MTRRSSVRGLKREIHAMPEPRGYKIAAYLDHETWHRLDQRSQTLDRSYSYLLRLAVKRMLDCEDCPIANLRSDASETNAA